MERPPSGPATDKAGDRRGQDVPITKPSREARVQASEAPRTERLENGSLALDSTLYARRPARQAQERIGKLAIAGRYRLLRVLGEGGMGTVFEASHVNLGKRVAVRILSGLFAGHDEASARFLREARAASAVRSEHIVQVFDVGEDLDAGLYMVM